MRKLVRIAGKLLQNKNIFIFCNKYHHFCTIEDENTTGVTNMDILLFVLLFTLIFSVTFLGHWIDSKYNVQIMRWMNLEVASPFKTNTPTSQSTKTPSGKSDELRERIENLEKIVTDSRWELNEKLRKL